MSIEITLSTINKRNPIDALDALDAHRLL